MISRSQRARRLSLFAHLLWLFVSVVLWSLRQFWQWRGTGFFSLAVYAKGLLLLWLAALIYGETCRRRPAFLFLGFFPLIWLSLSRLQWDLCSQPDPRYWIWLSVFLLLEFFLFAIKDGRQLFALVGSLGGVLSVLLPFSLPVFLSFGWIGNGRWLHQSRWVRFGLPVVGLVFFFVLKGQALMRFNWYDLYQIFVNDLFIGFFLLGGLGFLSLATRRNRWVPAFGPWILLCLGFLFLPGQEAFTPLAQETLKWALVFFAGFGWESFRRDMMDRTWHGRLVWFTLGFCFLGGVLRG